MSPLTDFTYRIHNAPSAATIDQAARLGHNWVIVHSAGIHGEWDYSNCAKNMDMFPIYFKDYPKVAESRHFQDSAWLEPLRREIRALSSRAMGHGMKVAFHMYEPTFPHSFEREYPDLVGAYHRPTQNGTVYIHSHVNPDNPATWDLIRNKYRELATDFPEMSMVILTTWDGCGSRWCLPKAKMPIPSRFVKMVEAARDGVRAVRKDIIVCFRLWGRNWPATLYRDSHRMISELTGLENADELMDVTVRPYNDPEKILPKIFEALPADVPLMYKSTGMDIHENAPLTLAVGSYPKNREQILEVSYEMYHENPWPWCKVQHIRRGLGAVNDGKLAGYVTLPLSMGNNTRHADPEAGNLGRMNTWLLEQILKGDSRTDGALVAAWLELEYENRQPEAAVHALLTADDLVDKGIQWGRGVYERTPFASLHTTKLYWMFDGFIAPEFPYEIANPNREFIDAMIQMKTDAYERACATTELLKAARVSMHPKLFEELSTGYQDLADFILLRRDWSSYILMQYGIERKLYPADRKTLGRMSRYVETFIKNLARLKDSFAGQRAMARLSFPDEFPLT